MAGTTALHTRDKSLSNTALANERELAHAVDNDDAGSSMKAEHNTRDISRNVVAALWFS
jgi:hypothetical protein